MYIGLAPSPAAKPATISTEAFEALRVGVTTQRAPSNSFASACSAPTSVLPAMGWPPTKLMVSGSTSCAQLITSALVEPVSVTMAPGMRALAISSITSRMARMGVLITTRRRIADRGQRAVLAFVDGLALLRGSGTLRVAVVPDDLDRFGVGVLP